MLTIVLGLSTRYLLKELKLRRKISNSEKEVIKSEFRKEFNEKYKRASKIKRIKRKNKVGIMVNKIKYKQ
jgi:hypothetical protein